MFVPVKINLGLRVLRRRTDGFHDLETLFVPCGAVGDSLDVTPIDAPLPTIELIGPEVDWNPQTDLTMRAWRLLKADFPQLPSVHIHLEKHSPVGAGLGGGSADATYTLLELNRIGSLGLSEQELAGYASRLGSDCAFFVYHRPMIGEGRGDVLTPWPLSLDGYTIRLGIPEGIRVSTREAYSGVLASRKAGIPLREALSRPVGEWRECLVNDFENTIFPLHPEIAALKQRFYDDGAIYASMSGSGSAVFGLFEK